MNPVFLSSVLVVFVSHPFLWTFLKILSVRWINNIRDGGNMHLRSLKAWFQQVNLYTPIHGSSDQADSKDRRSLQTLG